MGLDDFDRGRRIGKYEILTRLSVGGMAEIFLAYTAGPGGFRKFVTLKRILPDIADDEQFLSMFLEEARVTAAMSHASIAQVFELGEDDGDYYLTMEFIPGQDLRQLLRAAVVLNTRIPIGFAAMVIRDTCNALHYAHHFKDGSGALAAIVHRDVSPKNVMVTYEGDVKVIDFGIAKALGRLGHTRAGTVKGTTPYMSPEQILGEDLDGRSDLFAAGTILQELLTGRRTFSGEDEREVARRILTDTVAPASAANPDVPAALDAVLVHALERAPPSRFQTGKEMARAIEHAVGPLMFDEEQAGAFMRLLFAAKLARTQALLTLSVPVDEAERLRQAAGALRDDPGPESSSKLRSRIRPLPVEPPAFDEVATVASKGHQLPEKSQSTVMVVDDSAVGIYFVKSALAEMGCRVIGCPSPLQAISVFDTEKPDLVILDVVMPDLDGFEVCRLIREKNPSLYVPILFVSAACSLEERVKGLTVGGDDFIRKPCDREELVARVRIHLHRAASIRTAAKV